MTSRNPRQESTIRLNKMKAGVPYLLALCQWANDTTCSNCRIHIYRCLSTLFRNKHSLDKDRTCKHVAGANWWFRPLVLLISAADMNAIYLEPRCESVICTHTFYNASHVYTFRFHGRQYMQLLTHTFINWNTYWYYSYTPTIAYTHNHTHKHKYIYIYMCWVYTKRERERERPVIATVAISISDGLCGDAHDAAFGTSAQGASAIPSQRGPWSNWKWPRKETEWRSYLEASWVARVAVTLVVGLENLEISGWSNAAR